MAQARSIELLIQLLSRLPGVGPKSAQRIASHLLKEDEETARELARAIVRVKKSVRPCASCFNYTDGKVCAICLDENRDRTAICVVEAPDDVAALERSGAHRGLYHVLGGAINLAAGVGPESLRIKELTERIQKNEVREALIALNPNLEGETTAMYLAKILRPLGVRITRPARGLPIGADIDYLDGQTLSDALAARREI